MNVATLCLQVRYGYSQPHGQQNTKEFVSTDSKVERGLPFEAGYE